MFGDSFNALFKLFLLVKQRWQEVVEKTERCARGAL